MSTEEEQTQTNPTSPIKKETKVSEEVEKYLKIALDTIGPKIPQSVPPVVLQTAYKIVPHIGRGVELIEFFILYCIQKYPLLLSYYDKIAPYNPELLFPSVCGLILCFFGGCFASLIATVEAVHNFGYTGIKNSVLAIAKDIRTAWDAHKKDNEKDDNNDGIPDVEQINNIQLLNRKIVLMLKVIDPSRLFETFGYLNTAFLAILATLRVKFARSFTLAQGITNAVLPTFDAVLLPAMESLIPEEFRKWVKPVSHFIFNCFVISFAVTLQRIIDSIYSAIRGGLMFSRNIMEYLTIKDIYKIDHKETIIDEIIGYALAFIGFYFQLRIGFQIPFIFRFLFFPLTFLENLIIVLVGTVPP